jgi:hypothetical protein
MTTGSSILMLTSLSVSRKILDLEISVTNSSVKIVRLWDHYNWSRERKSKGAKGF